MLNDSYTLILYAFHCLQIVSLFIFHTYNMNILL